jgi:pimeloyl-ACP methyl ester carboxylesterase
LPEPPENLRQRAQNIAWLDPEFAHALVVGDRRETVRDVDFAAHARAITCPVLLLQADPAIGSAMQPEDVEFFMENVPHTRLEVIPGAGHGIHTDQPGLYLQVVDEFLGTLA